MLKLIVPVLLVISLPGAAAPAQIKRGTAIVVFYSKQRVVFAGDSRIILAGGSRDDQCKVSTLDKRFLFAASGTVGRENGWNAPREASRIATTIAQDATDGVEILAAKWGEWMRATLDAELVKNETQLLTPLHSGLANGVFAGYDKANGLAVYAVELRCACNETPKRAIFRVSKFKITTDGIPKGFLGSDEGLTLFNEVSDGNTERAKAERAAWVVSLPQDNSLAHDAGITIRTLEFILRYSGAPDVGGSIDAVALDSDGKIRWIQRKPNCSD